MQQGAVFCSRCGNSIGINPVVKSAAPAPQINPSIPPKSKFNKIYFIIGGIFCFSLILIGIIAFSAFSGLSTYNFDDSSSVKCNSDSSTNKNCGGISGKSDHDINEIGEISATDKVSYRQELIKKLEDKSAAINKECADPKAAQTDRTFQMKTGAYYIDLCTMDEKYLSSSLNILLNLYQKFPKSQSGVNSFTIAELDNGMYGGFQPKNLDTGGVYSTNYSDLTLSSKLFTTKNIDKPKKYYEQDLQSKFHPKNTRYDYVFAHEVGHGMEYLLALNEAGVKDLLASSDPDEYYDVISIWNNYEISKKIVKEAVANAQSKQTSNGQTKKPEGQMIKDISGYAAKKDKDGQTLYPETFAESITDYMANGINSSELTLEIIPIINREMAKI